MKKLVIFLVSGIFAHHSSAMMNGECDEIGEKGTRHVIYAIEYEKKDDLSSKPWRDPFFKKLRYKKLFCPVSKVKKCTENSVWFTLDDFVAYHANYKKTICHYLDGKRVDDKYVEKIVYYKYYSRSF